MKKSIIQALVAALAFGAAASASATVLQSFGAATAVRTTTNAATFEGNTLLANDWVEGGLLFHYSGSGDNNNCGYGDSLECFDSVSELGDGFSGNYMATAGSNAYISVRKASGDNFHGIEFAASSLFVNLNGYWRTLNDNVVTGSGNFSAASGKVLGLYDAAGFDEVRYFTFARPNLTTGFSSPAIDSVRVGEIPEPASLLMIGAGLLGLAGSRRKKTN
jgi:hypothetical protein